MFSEESVSRITCVLAVISILGMIPFAVKVDNYLTFNEWLIAILLDFGATILYSFVLILLRKVCVEYKQSELRYDAQTEPSLAELSFTFVCGLQ
eukprot:UN29785